MKDYQKIREACQNAQEALDLRIDSRIDETFATLIQIFEEEIPDGVKLDTEAMMVQLEVMSLMLKHHIQKGIVIDIGGHTLQMINLFEGIKKSGAYSADELERMEKIVMSTVKKSRDYLAKVANPPTPTIKFDHSGKCALCKKHIADAVGSHMVPHLLIQQVFSYDGTKGRDNEVAEMFNLAGGEYSNYFGRNINSEKMSDIINRPVSDAEIEYEGSKHSVFTRDHIFCENCEKRLMAVESFYSDILNGKIKNYPPTIPYLFWVSVVWRMSISNMGIKMYPKDEKTLGKILDGALSKERDKIVSDRGLLGDCAYGIYHCEDIKDETTGIMGMHLRTIPYKVLIGKDYINFFMMRCDARDFNERHGDPVDDFNDGTKKEKRKEIPFIHFWMAKRNILDENYVFDQKLVRKGIRPPETITRYIDKDKDLYASCGGKYISDVGLSTEMIKNDNMPMIPRAVMKIINYINNHHEVPMKDGMTDEEKVKAAREAMTKSTGYTMEEVEVIMSYWETVANGLKKSRRYWTFENV